MATVATTTQNVTDMAKTHPRIYRPQQWPGERRHPTRWDVTDAAETPAAAFLERFRVALLHSEGAEDEVLLDSELDPLDAADLHETSLYAYPGTMLSDVPALPSKDALAQLQASFFDSFDQHVFLESVHVSNWCTMRQPLYLPLALACLALVTTTAEGDMTLLGHQRNELAADLFLAGVNIWTFMLETDNRESRLCEATIAAALLSTYGALSSEGSHRTRVSGVLCNLATMSRRTHLIDGYSPVYACTELPKKAFGIKSSLVGYILLIDTMYAVQWRRTPNISTRELYIKMPTSNHHFRTVYNSMVHGYALPVDVKSREDALLLLVALLNDILYLQHCARSYRDESTNDAQLRNPFVPLSVHSECFRLTAEMSSALSRWEHHFKDKIDNDILALYHFTNLQLLCPDTGAIHTSPTNQTKSKPIKITDQALNLAWLILDQCHGISEKQRLGLWLPIILFQSAMVVWQRLKPSATDRKYGALSVLGVFGNELNKLPWPCCREMKEVLDGLSKG